MPTASERARREAQAWADWATILEEGPNPTEAEVMLLVEPAEDLLRRSRDWGHDLEDFSLSSVCWFAAALAGAEAEAWGSRQLDLATRAYEARRHLLTDRLVHWAVPYLLAVGEPGRAQFLLEMGDEMRLAPALPGTEGLLLAGEDSFGPLANTGSIWSGWVDVDGANIPDDAAALWEALAQRHPGTAQLWSDLAARAGRDGQF